MAKRKIDVRQSKPFEDKFGNRIVRSAHKREIEKKPELSKSTKERIRSGKAMRVPSNIYGRNYNKVSNIIDLDELKQKGYIKLKSEGFMDLNFDYLREDDQGRHIIAMSHYYKHPSGDMIADPDMELRIDEDMGTIEALTYQDASRYNEVYSRDGKYVNPRVKKSLNSFLSTWLNNCKNQGFSKRTVKAPQGEIITIDPSTTALELAKTTKDPKYLKQKFIVKVGNKYVSSPTNKLTENKELAGTISSREEAEALLEYHTKK
jgi:uncharacterized protein YqiB (DUF1249 family)